jgi:hypothetical protein
MKNIFDLKTSAAIIERIDKLTIDSKPVWGTMNVAQMLAHCCVTYEFIFENKHPKPNRIKRLLLKTFVKKFVVGPKPYKVNSRTAPEFIIANKRDFEQEKERLITYILKVQKLGSSHFENKDSHSFGVLTIQEWNNMFYKHLDHHLHQFSV